MAKQAEHMQAKIPVSYKFLEVYNTDQLNLLLAEVEAIYEGAVERINSESKQYKEAKRSKVGKKESKILDMEVLRSNIPKP
jgi:hypothetical protein